MSEAESGTISGDRQNPFAGVLLGTAVGDALGLPMEGISQRRQKRLFPGYLHHRFLFGKGMISDDTEHTVMVAQALLECPSDAESFQLSLSRKFRWWLCTLPAGVGFATLKAILKLWLGFPASKSGVWSAGNGPAMRSAILGVYFADDSARLRRFVRAGTRLTHLDPRAETAALAVAETAAWRSSQNSNIDTLIAKLRSLSETQEWSNILDQLKSSLSQQQSVSFFASSLGLQNGVTGYCFHSVPVAIYSVLRHPQSFRTAVEEAIACGGDTDTVGAITGALHAAADGPKAIPDEWRANIADWPVSVSYLERLAAQLTVSHQDELRKPRSCPVFWPATPVRNLFFLAVVLCHGLRRIFPPY